MSQPDISIDPVALLTVAAAVFIGPDVAYIAGPYAAIAIASAVGAGWALGRRPSTSHLCAALFVLRLVVTAMLISVVTEQAINRWIFETTGHWLLTPIALLVGCIGDDWPAVGKWLLVRGAKFFDRNTDRSAT